MELIQRSKENVQAAIRNKLLSPAEAAILLGTTPGVLSVWRTTKRYPLRYCKIGRSVKYRLEDVLAFIDARTVCPAEV